MAMKLLSLALNPDEMGVLDQLLFEKLQDEALSEFERSKLERMIRIIRCAATGEYQPRMLRYKLFQESSVFLQKYSREVSKKLVIEPLTHEK